MHASKHFNIRLGADDDWFDTILNNDTELFVDPFLVFKDESPYWKVAHEDIISHFNYAFILILEGNRNPDSLAFKKALHVLTFLEPREFCLGYTGVGTSGAGSGKGFASAIASAISDAIRRGMQNPRHFEELGILN